MRRVLFVVIWINILFFCTSCEQSTSKRVENHILKDESQLEEDSVIQNLYARAKILSLPAIDTFLNDDNIFYIKEKEAMALFRSGFNTPIKYKDSEIYVSGRLDILDTQKYLCIDIESKDNGLFGAGYLLILNLQYKVINQILLYSYGREAPDGCSFQILADKSIKIKEFYTLESEKIPPKPNEILGSDYKCYCKVVDKEYNISNGKVIEKINKPKFGYYIYTAGKFYPIADE